MTLAIAKLLDEKDLLKKYRPLFHIPQYKGKNSIYFCGNSLGLQPIATQHQFKTELADWANLGVDGHFHAKNPWLSFHKVYAEPLAKLVGAKKTEVVAMNSLTVNLHLMLTSFYQPTSKKFKIITEANSFSSDYYALKSHVKLHGLTPKKALIELKPRKGEYCLRTEDILKQITKHGNELALILMGGVNYYTGQAFDMEQISKAAKKTNAKVGFDLAHAIGNIPLSLHKWNVDFAVWCTYKYLNSGPGSVGGCFIHEKHLKNKKLQRLAGWWGHDEKSRFQMSPTFRPIPTAEGWQISNAPIFNMLAHKTSLEIFNEVGIKALVKKSRLMTTFLEDSIKNYCIDKSKLKIKLITPGSIEERGCQLSILVPKNGELLFEKLTKAGFVVDWRSPNVIRVAPVPLYNTYQEVYQFVRFLSKYCFYQR